MANNISQKQKELNNLLFSNAALFDPVLMRRFIDMGADVNARNRFDETPILGAGYAYGSYFLKDPFNKEFREKVFKVVQLLVEKGADVNVRNCNGGVIGELINAGLSVDDPLFQYLVEAGADIHFKANEGCSALHYARTPEMMKFLISQGLDVNVSTPSGVSPLFSVTTHLDDLELVKVLIEAGADINAACLVDGYTALMNVCSYAPDIAHYLLDEGADPNIRNKDGDTALHIILDRWSPPFKGQIVEDPEHHENMKKLLDRLLEVTEF